MPIERSTCVLVSSLALILLFWQWRPIGGEIRDVGNSIGRMILWGLFGMGWLLVLLSTLQINHLDLFGMRQVWLFFRGTPYTPVKLATPLFYKHVRHPLCVGWITAF